MKYIVLYGSAGPFDSSEDALSWAMELNTGSAWEVLPLEGQ